MSRFSLFLFLFQIFFYPSVVLSVNQDLYLDSSISYEKRIEDLMSKMTLEEKIAQMCQYVGLNYLNNTADNMTAEEILNSDSKASYPGLKAKDIADMIVDGEIGSFLHVLTPKHANQLQELALRSRLKIPLLIGIDAIHGNGMVKGTTIYPSPITIASSFSDKFAFQVGRQTALEMRATGSHWAFTPNVDVLRDPRWGRSGETFGEDPYLVSNLGVNTIKGLQLDDYTGLDKVIACAKHFIAGSDPNNGLNFAPMDVSERTLREIYLKPYKKAIEANVYTMMAAHNEVNGIPSHMHKPLIKGIIRDEYNFNGFFVSDWLDIERLETLHFVANDLKEASYLSVDAGIDMHMHGPYFLEAVRDLVKEGKLNEQRINDACRKILMAKFKLGLFENPFVDLEKVKENIFTIEHQKTALNIARKSIVLLENNEILPLKKQTRKKILVTGPNANNHSILGDWTKPQPPKNVTTIFEGIKEIGNEYNYQVDYYDSGENIRNITDENIKATANKASEYDYIVLVVGDNSLRHLGFSLESGKTAGENMARADINLAGNQLELVKALNAVGNNLIVVYVNGKAIAEPWVTDNVDALIEAWEPGSFGGQAVAEIIFGDINPSGKLPVTFPRHVGQLQMIYNHKPSQYFKKYAFEKITPLYPFGYGLSYSDFDYSSMKINVYEDDKIPHISIVVDIKNNSDIDGEEITQLYFRDSISSVSRPVKELIDYKRIYIPAGKTRTVQFTVPIEKLSFYDINMSQCVEPGEFVFMVGSSSSNNDLLVNTININNRYDY